MSRGILRQSQEHTNVIYISCTGSELNFTLLVHIVREVGIEETLNIDKLDAVTCIRLYMLINGQ